MNFVNWQVAPGDTLTGIMKQVWNGINEESRQTIITELKRYYLEPQVNFILPEEQRALWLCLAEWVGNFNGKNWNLYNNIPSSNISDPDTLQVGDIIKIPAPFAMEVTQDINLMRCIVQRLGFEFQEFEQTNEPTQQVQTHNYNKLLFGGGLLLLLLLLINKDKK